MTTAFRWLARLVGAFFALQGVTWLVSPERAATGLAMPLLDGLARSTQVGDFAAFFLAIGATALVGSREGSSRLLWVPAGILWAAAAGRSLAWALHGAALANTFIGVELIAGGLFALAALRLTPRA